MQSRFKEKQEAKEEAFKNEKLQVSFRAQEAKIASMFSSLKPLRETLK